MLGLCLRTLMLISVMANAVDKLSGSAATQAVETLTFISYNLHGINQGKPTLNILCDEKVDCTSGLFLPLQNFC